MKKIILTAIISLSTLFAINIYAQTASFGVKLNGNLTDVKVSGSQSGNSFKPGATVGGFAKIEFGKRFVLQPELLVNYTEAKVTTLNEKVKFKYASVEIPVYAMAQFNAGSGKLYVGAGPNVGYGFSADVNTEKLPEWNEGSNKLEISQWYTGAGVIAGYEFKKGFSINAGYKLGYNVGSKSDSAKADTQTISLGVAYRF